MHYLLSAHYVLGTILGARTTARNGDKVTEIVCDGGDKQYK